MKGFWGDEAVRYSGNSKFLVLLSVPMVKSRAEPYNTIPACWANAVARFLPAGS